MCTYHKGCTEERSGSHGPSFVWHGTRQRTDSRTNTSQSTTSWPELVAEYEALVTNPIKFPPIPRGGYTNTAGQSAVNCWQYSVYCPATQVNSTSPVNTRTSVVMVNCANSSSLVAPPPWQVNVLHEGQTGQIKPDNAVARHLLSPMALLPCRSIGRDNGLRSARSLAVPTARNLVGVPLTISRYYPKLCIMRITACSVKTCHFRRVRSLADS